MTMKLLKTLRSIIHTLSMGRLFKPHQDPTVCPEHGPMAGITGPANPDIDPDKMWDTIYYCPECLQEEQEAEKKALTEDSEKSDNKALPFKDREPKLMRGAPMTDDEDCCRPWVSPDDPHVTSDPQTYTTEDLLELGIEGGGGPQPLRLCGFCKSQLPDIEYCIWMTKDDGDLTIYPNDPEDLKARLITTRLTDFLTMEISNYAWLHCDECHAANWVGGDD